MKLPPTAYVGIAVFAATMCLSGVISCLAGIRNWPAFFTWYGARHLDQKMGRRGARVFCLAVGAVVAMLGLVLLVVALLPLFPTRRLRLLEPVPKVEVLQSSSSD